MELKIRNIYFMFLNIILYEKFIMQLNSNIKFIFNYLINKNIIINYQS